MGSDHRLGSHFFKASLGFGGSCFQKDILNLVYLAESLHLTPVAAYFTQVLKMNAFTKGRFTQNVVRKLFGTVRDKKLAVLGFAFKANTGDTRESPAIQVVANLLEEGAHVCVYDPKVTADQIRKDLGLVDNVAGGNPNEARKKRLEIVSTAYEACKEAHAVLICTDWQHFQVDQLDFERIYSTMQRPAYVFDGRRVVDARKLTDIGFHVERVGERPLQRNAERLLGSGGNLGLN